MTRVAFGTLHKLEIRLPKTERDQFLNNTKTYAPLSPGAKKGYAVLYKQTDKVGLIRIAVDDQHKDSKDTNDRVEYALQQREKGLNKNKAGSAVYQSVPGPFYGSVFSSQERPEFVGYQAVPIPIGHNVLDPTANQPALNKIEIYKKSEYQATVEQFRHTEIPTGNPTKRKVEVLPPLGPLPDFKSLVIARLQDPNGILTDYWSSVLNTTPKTSKNSGLLIFKISGLQNDQKLRLFEEAKKLQWITPGVKPKDKNHYFVGYHPEKGIRVAIDDQMPEKYKAEVRANVKAAFTELRSKFDLPEKCIKEYDGPFYGRTYMSIDSTSRSKLKNRGAMPIPAGPNIFDPKAGRLFMAGVEIYELDGKYENGFEFTQTKSKQPLPQGYTEGREAGPPDRPFSDFKSFIAATLQNPGGIWDRYQQRPIDTTGQTGRAPNLPPPRSVPIQSSLDTIVIDPLDETV